MMQQILNRFLINGRIFQISGKLFRISGNVVERMDNSGVRLKRCNFSGTIIVRSHSMHPARIFIVLFFLSSAPASVWAQEAGKYWSAGFNLGIIGFSPTTLVTDSGTDVMQRTGNGIGFGEVEDVNGRKSLSLIANTSIGMHGG